MYSSLHRIPRTLKASGHCVAFLGCFSRAALAIPGQGESPLLRQRASAQTVLSQCLIFTVFDSLVDIVREGVQSAVQCNIALSVLRFLLKQATNQYLETP